MTFNANQNKVKHSRKRNTEKYAASFLRTKNLKHTIIYYIYLRYWYITQNLLSSIMCIHTWKTKFLVKNRTRQGTGGTASTPILARKQETNKRTMSTKKRTTISDNRNSRRAPCFTCAFRSAKRYCMRPSCYTEVNFHEIAQATRSIKISTIQYILSIVNLNIDILLNTSSFENISFLSIINCNCTYTHIYICCIQNYVVTVPLWEREIIIPHAYKYYRGWWRWCTNWF